MWHSLTILKSPPSTLAINFPPFLQLHPLPLCLEAFTVRSQHIFSTLMSSHPAFHRAFLLFWVNDSGSCCATSCLHISHIQPPKDNGSFRLLLSMFLRPAWMCCLQASHPLWPKAVCLGVARPLFFAPQCFCVNLQPFNTVSDPFLSLKRLLRKCVSLYYIKSKKRKLDVSSLKVNSQESVNYDKGATPPLFMSQTSSL